MLQEQFLTGSDDSHHRFYRNWTNILVISSLIIGLTITFIVSTLISRDIHAQAADRFIELARDLQQDCESRLNSAGDDLINIRSLEGTIDHLTLETFRNYLSNYSLENTHQGLTGIFHVQYLPKSKRASYIAEVRKEIGAQFQLHTTDDSENLFVVRYAFPKDLVNDNVGVDLSQNSVIRSAVIQAVDTGLPSVTDKFSSILGLGDSVGYSIVVPVFRRGSHPETSAERWSVLDSVLLAPISLENVLNDVDIVQGNKLDVDIFAGTQASQANLMLDTVPIVRGEHREMVTYRKVKVANQDWLLRISSLPAFDSQFSYSAVWQIAMLGLFLTALVTFMFWFQGEKYIRENRRASEVLSELVASNQANETLINQKVQMVNELIQATQAPLLAINGFSAILNLDPSTRDDAKNREQAIAEIRRAGSNLQSRLNNILHIDQTTDVNVESNQPVPQTATALSDQPSMRNTDPIP